ncbi:hypothetical protein HYH03_006030 [Edaphochlamys debaryana]|uniref:Uncharacterized protein n=1 Tax=Edaphochlamys debaryana TaxID=47281 RepID=A0A835Y7T9_9CHLO|nr:hypothetical protein HYH03_006030 [Edaphochlamys debaryana]|eukprot:KAG2495786.1 hypothetical protein HYH03_006030 [Edaphochlamys debaryana]
MLASSCSWAGTRAGRAAELARVRRVLASAPNLDSIIEEVPYLTSPAALAQSLSNVSRWYNTKDPVSVIAKNPKALLNVEEADLEADPLYGELTTAG